MKDFAFSIHRVITQSPIPSPIRQRTQFALDCLRRTCEGLLKPVTVLQTAGGFLFSCIDLLPFPVGTSSRNEDYAAVVEIVERQLLDALTPEVVSMLSAKTDFVTFGVDVFQKTGDEPCDYDASRKRKHGEKHAELVGTFYAKDGKFIGWTGKSHPTSSQQNSLLYCIDVESHLQYFGKTPVLVLGCHDLNIFSPRSRKSSRSGTYKGNLISEMQGKCNEFKPEVVLQHPHTTDSPQIWATAWSGVRKYLPTVKAYASGIHYENLRGGAQRRDLGKVIAATQFGNVGNAVIEKFTGI